MKGACRAETGESGVLCTGEPSTKFKVGGRCGLLVGRSNEKQDL